MNILSISFNIMKTLRLVLLDIFKMLIQPYIIDKAIPISKKNFERLSSRSKSQDEIFNNTKETWYYI